MLPASVGTRTATADRKLIGKLAVSLFYATTALAATAPCAVSAAEEAAVDLPTLWVAQKEAAAAAAAENQTFNTAPVPWGAQKSYLIPALEIVGFATLLNLFDRAYYGCCDFDVNLSTIKRNLHRDWVVDSDSFTVNQLGHPYQGSMYHGFARASGLNFWESLGYTFAGSLFWEIAGETTPPSKNDQIMTGIGGAFLGEPLFRMANLVLEQSEGVPQFWREIAAAVASPSMAFNRLAYGDRFRGIFPSNKPAYYSRLQIGGVGTTQNTPDSTDKLKRNEALLDFSIDYGLPGKPGYTYTRPFDYFNFQVVASTANGVESVNTRGLLLGKDYEGAANYRGVWGLYGSYDYLAPQLFRVSSTALSVGTTAQWGLSESVELQGTGMLGVGYTSVGTIHDAANEHDNHYGVSPQALLALRLIFGDTASLDLTGREYFVSRLGAGTAEGHDNIVRLDASLTVRVYKQHAVAVKYLVTRRDASTLTTSDLTQTRGTVGIFYTLLGHERFGAVNWRQ